MAAAFRTNGGVKYAGAIIAETGCWSMLKGGLTVEGSGPAQLYFEVIILYPFINYVLRLNYAMYFSALKNGFVNC